MCAGKGERWKGDIPKQLAEIKGKPNLLRTMDMLVKLGVSHETITITVNKENMSSFPQELNLFIGSAEREIDRFRNSFPLIDNCQKVTYLYGDVVYAEDDLKTIIHCEKNAFLGRENGNVLTKKAWGEIFGVVTVDVKGFIQDVNHVAHLFESRKIQREIGWEVYKTKKNKYEFVELSLHTDDFDTLLEHEMINLLKFIQ